MKETKALVNNKQIIQTLTVTGILLSLVAIWAIRAHPSYFAVGGEFQQFLTNIGVLGPFVFILVQIIQVIYPIIPGGLTCILGHALFGPLYGFIYNFTGVLTGSILSFLLARRYGEGFVKSFVSQKTYDKYIGYVNGGKTFEGFLVAAFVLPGFPDDFLCMVAGMSKMTLKKFFWITLISKPATLYLYTWIGYHGLQAISQFFS